MAETKVVITNNISGVIKEINDHIRKRMGKACVTVRDRAVDSMKEAKTGNVYTTYFFTMNGRIIPIGKRWKPHQASAPGEPPAIDTGELAQHIIIEVSESGYEGSVGVAAGETSKNAKATIGEIGKWLEMGSSKVAARPWLKPAFESSLDKIKEIFTAPME